MKTIYYDDELNNEFSEAQITPKKIKNGMASNLIITSILTNLF